MGLNTFELLTERQREGVCVLDWVVWITHRPSGSIPERSTQRFTNLHNGWGETTFRPFLKITSHTIMKPKHKKFLDELADWSLIFAMIQGLLFMAGSTALFYLREKPILTSLSLLFFVAQLVSLIWVIKRTD